MTLLDFYDSVKEKIKNLTNHDTERCKMARKSIVRMQRFRAEQFDRSLISYFQDKEKITVDRIKFEQEKIEKLSLDIDIIGLVDHFKDKFDIYGVYCNKTGRKIGQRSNEDIELAMAVNGLSQLKELWPYISYSNVSTAWINTSENAREKLFQYDPLGYLVFAASVTFRYNMPGFIPGKSSFVSAFHEVNFFVQKIALYEKLKDFPIDDVIKAANAFHMYLGIMGNYSRASQVLRSNIAWLAQLANKDIIAKLPEILKMSSARELQRLGYGTNFGLNIDILNRMRENGQRSIFTRNYKTVGNLVTEQDRITAMLDDLGINAEMSMPAKGSYVYKLQVAEARGLLNKKKYHGKSHSGGLTDLVTEPENGLDRPKPKQINRQPIGDTSLLGLLGKKENLK